MRCCILTSSQELFNDEIAGVTLPGSDGYLQVLVDHMPSVVLLKAGVVTLTLKDGSIQRFLVSSGIASVEGKVTIMADHCELYSPAESAYLGELINVVMAQYEEQAPGPQKQSLFNQLDALKRLNEERLQVQ